MSTHAITFTTTQKPPAPLCRHCHQPMTIYQDLNCAGSITYWCHCFTPPLWRTIHTRNAGAKG